MFWVVDNFLMKKHRTKAKLEEREEESRGSSKVRYRRALSHDDSESEVSFMTDICSNIITMQDFMFDLWLSCKLQSILWNSKCLIKRHHHSSCSTPTGYTWLFWRPAKGKDVYQNQEVERQLSSSWPHSFKNSRRLAWGSPVYNFYLCFFYSFDPTWAFTVFSLGRHDKPACLQLSPMSLLIFVVKQAFISLSGWGSPI